MNNLKRDPLDIQHQNFENSRLGSIVFMWDSGWCDIHHVSQPQIEKYSISSLNLWHVTTTAILRRAWRVSRTATPHSNCCSELKNNLQRDPFKIPYQKLKPRDSVRLSLIIRATGWCEISHASWPGLNDTLFQRNSLNPIVSKEQEMLDTILYRCPWRLSRAFTRYNGSFGDFQIIWKRTLLFVGFIHSPSQKCASGMPTTLECRLTFLPICKY